MSTASTTSVPTALGSKRSSRSRFVEQPADRMTSADRAISALELKVHPHGRNDRQHLDDLRLRGGLVRIVLNEPFVPAAVDVEDLKEPFGAAPEERAVACDADIQPVIWKEPRAIALRGQQQ